MKDKFAYSMTKFFRFFAVLLIWCSSTHGQDFEPRGTYVGDPYCGSGINKHNLYTRVANGKGGTYRNTLEINSEQCGYTGAPACPVRGTDLNIQYCEGPNLYTRIANGMCGSYRNTVEVESPQCIVLDIDETNTVGDRFVPVVFDVSFTMAEQVLEWDYEITDSTIGNITKTPDSLLITGDGRIGTGIITIEGEEYSYEIVNEPRCELTQVPYSQSYTDCMGYSVGGSGQLGREAGFIYYGEDDERIVEWEWGWLWARNDEPYVLLEPSDDLYQKAEWYVEKMNEILELSGVFARIKLVGVATGISSLQVNMNNLYELGMPRFDALAQEGTTYPNTCGVAYGTGSINKSPRTWLSNCGWYTILHEFGHNVGLNHGPFNSANEGTGWIFYDFGHGHYTNCVNKDDIMAYSSYGMYFANSKILCSEMFTSPSNQPDLPSGIRDGSWEEDIGDTAYALNRIRYDIAMIHDENEIVTEGLEYITVDAKPTGTLIID